tara:strand:+ start:2051 stop:2500 length:450 start_codon:yes stop_codon:yes gene_type:complete
MGIGPQNLGAAGMNPKSKPCGTPLKMSEDSPILKALVGNQKNLPDHLKKKILAAPEDAKKGNPEGDGPLKLTVKGMDFSEDSAGADKYITANINEGEIETASADELSDGLGSLFEKKNGDGPPKKDVVPSATRGSMRDYIKRKRDMGKI